MTTAIDVLRKIVSKNNLQIIFFGIYRPLGWKAGTTKHFKSEKEPEEIRDPINALEHSPLDGLFVLKSEQVLGSQFQEIIDYRPNQSAAQVLSRTFSTTLAQSGMVHIPMLDIEFAPNDKNLSYLLSCMRALGEKAGAILLSGASYHYYGYNLLTEEAWLKFMYKSLLLDGIVDTRWIGHRLIDGHANLRITPKEECGFIPYVVAEL